jgi:hypothetical protein
MSLLALQSVATGRSRFPASMHDRWDGILGNVMVKMFMRVNDVEPRRARRLPGRNTHSSRTFSTAVSRGVVGDRNGHDARAPSRPSSVSHQSNGRRDCHGSWHPRRKVPTDQ